MESNTILSKKWSSCPSELCHIRSSITDACTEMHYTKADTNAIVLAIDEACTNIMRYAYNSCSDGEIYVEVKTSQEEAIFRLHDHAKKVTDECIAGQTSKLKEPGGLGVMLMKEVMDTVHFVHTDTCPGNILEMTKALPNIKAKIKPKIKANIRPNGDSLA